MGVGDVERRDDAHGVVASSDRQQMAVANAVLDQVLAPGFLERVQHTALRLKQQLAMLKDTWPGIIEEVRGQGLLLGLKTRVPNTDFVAALRAQHLLAIGAGDNVTRIIPPLIAGDAEIAEATAAIAAACAALSKTEDAAA